MKKAISGRQTGKTEKLIRLASDTGAVIITVDKGYVHPRPKEGS